MSRVALPCGRDEIEAAVLALRGAPVLLGARGGPAVSMTALVDAIDALADLAVALGDELVAIEVNPLRVFADRAVALDATVQWRAAS